MFKHTITRILGRRKIETVTIAVVAALSAISIARRDGVAATLKVTAPEMRYLAAATTGATVASASGAATGNATQDLSALEHPRVASWIKRFTTDQRATFATYLSRMTRYEDMISSKLTDRRMPQGLIYLAMIESGFDANARSPVKASGLWQFMSATGKQYGLTVSKKLDERNNPSRATDAALKYLSVLHNRFGSWYLAAAAYNSGEGTVTRAMKDVTGRTQGSDADYYRISHRLPKETRDYVPKLVAAALIGNNPGKYGFSAD